MFTFFGLFADPLSDLPRQISEIWPDLKPIRIEQPISAIATRFGQQHYEREREDIPEPIVSLTEGLSSRVLQRASCCFAPNASEGRVQVGV
jgi:hypothetical protein